MSGSLVSYLCWVLLFPGELLCFWRWVKGLRVFFSELTSDASSSFSCGMRCPNAICPNLLSPLQSSDQEWEELKAGLVPSSAAVIQSYISSALALHRWISTCSFHGGTASDETVVWCSADSFISFSPWIREEHSTEGACQAQSSPARMRVCIRCREGHEIITENILFLELWWRTNHLCNA